MAQKEIVSVNDHNREGRSKKPEDRPSSEKMDTILSERSNSADCLDAIVI